MYAFEHFNNKTNKINTKNEYNETNEINEIEKKQIMLQAIKVTVKKPHICTTETVDFVGCEIFRTYQDYQR